MKTHLTYIRKTLIGTAVLGVGLAVTAPAYAINAQKDNVTVKIDTRDLSTERGIEQVYRKLSRKAEASCKTPGSKSIGTRVADNVCSDRLLNDFVQDVDNVKLTSYHKAQKASS